MKIILITLAALLLCFGCTKVNEFLGQDSDWIGEEIIESIVETKLGLNPGSLDFSPLTPE